MSAWPPALAGLPSVSAERRLGALPLPHTLLPHGCACVAKQSCVFYKQSWKRVPLPSRNIQLEEGAGLYAYITAGGMFISAFSFQFLPAGLGSNPNHCFLKTVIPAHQKGTG